MLINHHGLSPMDPNARKYLEGEMQAYFFGSGSDTPDGFTPQRVNIEVESRTRSIASIAESYSWETSQG